MIWDAIQTVKTSGINWPSVLLIAGSIVGCIVALLGFLDIRQRRRQDDIRDEITRAVNHLSDVLLEKLETKDNVNDLKTEVAVMHDQIVDLKRQVLESKRR